MLVEVILSAVYITAACLCIRFVPAIQNLIGVTAANYPGVEHLSIVLNSAVFATFMMAITFNGFNARTEHLNILKHIEKNRSFRVVMGAIFVLQFVFVTFGGNVLHVTPLNVTTWLICLAAAFLVIPADLLRKLIVRRRERIRHEHQ